MTTTLQPAAPAYRIETPRLVLHVWSPEHAEQLKQAEDESREHLAAFLLPAKKIPQPLDAIVEKLRIWRADMDQGQSFRYGAFDRTTGSVVGGAGLHPWTSEGGRMIGYWLRAGCTKKGLATEMAAALTRVAFEVGKLRFVEIRCAKSNVPSARIPLRLGYVHEATLRERVELPSGVWDDSLVFSMLASEYEVSPAKEIAITAFDAANRSFSFSMAAAALKGRGG